MVVPVLQRHPCLGLFQPEWIKSAATTWQSVLLTDTGAQLVKRGKRRGFLVKSGEQASLHKERHTAGEQRVVDVTMTRGAPEVLFLVF